MDSNIPRGQCYVALQAISIINIILRVEVLEFLSCIERFEEVALHIKLDRKMPRDSVADFIQSRLEGLGLKLVGQSVYRTLGTAGVVSHQDGFAMIFYPRNHAEEFAGMVKEQS